MEKPNQPGQPGQGDVVLGDAVLGGQAPRPGHGVVLGGLEGVKQRLASQVVEQRVAALSEALKHGAAGLALVVQALGDHAEQVQQEAYALLHPLPEPWVQQAVQRFVMTQVKRRLKSAVIEERIASLPDAMVQGDEGLNLVIRALRDESDKVQQAAYHLLREHSAAKVKKALELFSAAGVSYVRLRDLLALGEWKLADRETRNMLYKACGLQPTDPHSPKLQEIACDDLKLMDRLWMHYSQGRFGFSVQARFWQECYTTYWDKSTIWSTFGDRVGWRVNHLLRSNYWKRYNELTFSLDAPVGHLPHLGDRFGIFTIETLVRRLQECES